MPDSTTDIRNLSDEGLAVLHTTFRELERVARVAGAPELARRYDEACMECEMEMRGRREAIEAAMRAQVVLPFAIAN